MCSRIDESQFTFVPHSRTFFSRRVLTFLVWLLPQLCCNNAGSRITSPLNSGESSPRASLQQRSLQLDRLADIEISDQKKPIEFMDHIAILADGTLLQADRRARLVRWFSPDGQLLGHLRPSEVPEREWRPESVDTDISRKAAFVNESTGKLWRFNYSAGTFTSRLVFQNPILMLRFRIGPDDAVYALGAKQQAPRHSIRLLRKGMVAKSFLEQDDNDRSLGLKFHIPALTFDDDGNIYAIRNLDRMLFVFNSEGKQMRAWEVAQTRFFRAFKPGFDPFKTTRDISLLREWERTFTVFGRLEYLARQKLLLVFGRNAPPDRPNTIDVYTVDSEHLGTISTPQYLIGKDAEDHIYMCDQHVLIENHCRITKYALIAR